MISLDYTCRCGSKLHAESGSEDPEQSAEVSKWLETHAKCVEAPLTAPATGDATSPPIQLNEFVSLGLTRHGDEPGVYLRAHNPNTGELIPGGAILKISAEGVMHRCASLSARGLQVGGPYNTIKIEDNI